MQPRGGAGTGHRPEGRNPVPTVHGQAGGTPGIPDARLRLASALQRAAVLATDPFLIVDDEPCFTAARIDAEIEAAAGEISRLTGVLQSGPPPEPPCPDATGRAAIYAGLRARAARSGITASAA